MNDITIKELADQLGITKTGIRRYLDDLPAGSVYKMTVNGTETTLIQPEGVEIIKDRYRAKHPETVTGNRTDTGSQDVPERTYNVPGTEPERTGMLQLVVDIQQERIADLRHQIETQEHQIQDLSDRLADALTALKNMTDQECRPEDPAQETTVKRPWWRLRK